MDEYHHKTYREQFLKFYRETHPPGVRFGPIKIQESDSESITHDSRDQALHHMASAQAYFQGSGQF